MAVRTHSRIDAARRFKSKRTRKPYLPLPGETSVEPSRGLKRRNAQDSTLIKAIEQRVANLETQVNRLIELNERPVGRRALVLSRGFTAMKAPTRTAQLEDDIKRWARRWSWLKERVGCMQENPAGVRGLRAEIDRLERIPYRPRLRPKWTAYELKDQQLARRLKKIVTGLPNLHPLEKAKP